MTESGDQTTPLGPEPGRTPPRRPEPGSTAAAGPEPGPTAPRRPEPGRPPRDEPAGPRRPPRDEPAGPPYSSTEPPAGTAPRSVEHRFERGLELSRTMVLVPVVVLSLTAAAAFVYGAALFVWGLIKVVPHPFPVENKIALFLLDIDLFLVGATLLIAAIGFYELFISRIDVAGTHLPSWLVMRDLNDLKARVISMLVLVAAVSFVDVVVDFRGGHDILFLGGGVALVIAALTAFLRFSGDGREGQ